MTSSTVSVPETFHGRRRKRARSSDEERVLSTLPSKSSSQGVPRLDDSTSTFFGDNGDCFADKEVVQSSLLILLEERRLGMWCGKPKIWQDQTLKRHIHQRGPGQPRREWRSFAANVVPFTHLGTPPGDAVLAMDRHGSFVLCLGTKDIYNAPLALSLRFYGISSPSRVLTQASGFKSGNSDGRKGAILLQTTPLLYELLQQPPSESLSINDICSDISPATTPVKILISDDWRMGVAMIRPSMTWNDEGPVGTLILFTTPCGTHTQSMRSTIWQCTNVKMGADASFSHRNLLWRVEIVPVTGSNAKDPVACRDIPGYLFLNDEDDGFRLTWATQDWPEDNMSSRTFQPSEPAILSFVEPTIRCLSFEMSWERIDCDRLSGERILPALGKPSGVKVINEGHLNIQVLLNDVLSRRRSMDEMQPLDFSYNLVSIKNAGRLAEIVVTFIRRQRPGSLGFFVDVDIFSGRYQERNWMKNVNSRDPVALRSWCNALALNQRMKELRLGPFSVKPIHAMDWSKLCIESSFDPDEDDNFQPHVWHDYVSSTTSSLTNRKPPKFISISSLYQDCDLITNKAITDCLPVRSIRGKNSPTELVYG